MMGQRQGLFAMLKEPVVRVDSGWIILPLDESWLRLLKAAGNVSLILIPLIALSFFLPMPGSGPAPILLRLLQLILALAFGITARRLSQGLWLPPSVSAETARKPEMRTAGVSANMVHVLFDVALFAMFGMIVGHVFDLFDLGGLLRQRLEFDPGLFAGIGVRCGAIAGLLISDVSRDKRMVLAAGIAAETGCGFLLNSWIGIPVLLAMVAAASWATDPSPRATESTETRIWRAMCTAWAFVFGATIGGMAGSVVGLVFMGSAGMVVGEMLGDTVIATAALMLRES
jgi:hypothetical protein